jgi:AcrR family transcriptional regulator
MRMPNPMSSDATKRLMVRSLKKLMAKKPLNKISIREITEDSGVNRQTFYYHFDDINDMVHWMFQEEAFSLIAEQEGVLFWQDGVRRLLAYLEDNRAVCLCALNSLGRQSLRRFFYDDIHVCIGRTVFSFANSIPNIPHDYGEFLTHFHAVAMAGMVESWLMGDIKQSADEIIHYMDMTLKDQIRGALARSSTRI